MHTPLTRLILLLTCTVVPLCSTLAQDWKQLVKKADSLEEMGDFPIALLLVKQAVNQVKSGVGEAHVDYAFVLQKLGSAQLSKGDYTDARESLVASQQVYLQVGKRVDTNYVEVLYGLGILNRIQGKYAEAEKLLQETLELTEIVRGRRTTNYAAILGSLGNVYAASQNYKKAEPLLLDVLTLKAELFGTRSNEYASTLNSLGLVYLNLEDYTRSELYFQKGLGVWEELFGPDHSNVGAILGNLGFLYINQGAYDAALQLLTRAELIQNRKAPGSLNHISALTNIALCYTRTKQYTVANGLYRKVLDLTEQKFGKTHPQSAIILNNLGFVAEGQGKYTDAIEQYQKALRLYNTGVGEETIGAAEMLSNIASAYRSMNEMSLSDSLYRRALTIIQRQVGSNSLRYAGTLNYFGQLLENSGQLDSAIVVSTNAQKIFDDNLTRNFFYQTARQKQSLLDKWAPSIQTAFDLSLKYPQRSDAAMLAYSGSLFLKNLLLSQYISLFAEGAQTKDTQLQTLTDTLRQVSRKIAIQYTLPIAQRKSLDSLEARAEALEKDLARQSAPFRQARQALQVRWQDVRNALKPTEAAIEFVSFPYHNGRQQTDTVRYMALVVRPGDTAPQVVPMLSDEAPLRRLLARKKGTLGGASLYATRGSELDTDQLTKGDSLYQLIWQPLDSLLGNTRTVYLAPSGLLHQVSFAALPYYANPAKNGIKYLSDRYQIRLVGSTRQVATPTDDNLTYQNMMSAKLFGGIQYDSAGTALGAWPFLPGTQREVEEIGRFIGPKATVKMGSAATETNLKAESGQSPTVLHLATHGFAFPDPAVATYDSTPGGSAFRRIANPLFRTGLLLAGANRTWVGGRPEPGEDDGILTAYEVANLNLSNTKLVVLSACETALGDIRGSEGVFGLQRAFKMAGAGYLLTSLWPVSDQATSDLMTRFYRNWKRYKTIWMAFQQTQQQMRQQYPPSVWASFVLIE